MTFEKWAERWGLPQQALVELESVVAPQANVAVHIDGESAVSSLVRLEAAHLGKYLWRNNVGAAKTDTGSFIRFGLANDSAKVNKVLKSGDLIGIQRRHITQADVGKFVGQFLSREIKHPGWVFNPKDERDVAQRRWATLINSLGGDAAIVTGVGSL